MELLILLGLILLNGVFASSELALVSAKRIRLQARAEKGDRGAKSALQLQDDPSRFLSTVQIGITMIGIIAGAYGATALADDFAPWIIQVLPILTPYANELAFALVIALTTYLSLVVGELVPKRIALAAPEVVASLISRPMSLLSRVAFPFVWLLRLSTEALLKLLGLGKSNPNVMTEAEIHSVIDEGTSSGAIEAEERVMIRGVMRLADRDVRSIMTPRHEIVWVNAKDPMDVVIRKIGESGHSRFPFADGDIEHITGIVQTKDMLAHSTLDPAFSLEAISHKPIFVPETLSVMKLLDAMQNSAVRMAIVIDEHGVIQGIVTNADLLGAIAGASVFSAEDGIAQPKQREDGSWLIDGLMAIDDLNLLLSTSDLGEDDGHYTTVAGLVMHRLQRLPKLGDIVEAGTWRFEVVDMDGRRIDALLISRMAD